MDRAVGKFENRNYDGERLMISLLKIARNINEAKIDDDEIIKYKDKEGESQEMTAGAAKKQPDDHPAKVAYNKMVDKGGDSEKDSGGKLGGSDFKRDGGEEPSDDKPSADDMGKGKPNEDDDDYAKMTDDAQEKVAKEYGLSAMNLYDNAGKEPEDFNSWNEYEDHLHDVAKDLVDKGYGDQPDDDIDDDDDKKKSAESENEDIIGELEDLVTSSKQKFRYFDVEKEDSEIDDGRFAVVRGNVKDDPDQHMSITAVQDPDGGDIDYSINIGIGGTPIYFGSKEEAMEAAKKLLDDETIRDTMNGDGDPKHTVLADLDQHAKNVLLPDDHPDKPLPAQTFDYYRTGKELDNETKIINGVKYKAIKEEKKSNKHILKENYDRFFGDKK